MSEQNKPQDEPKQDDLMNDEELESVAGGCQWTDSGMTGDTFTKPPTWQDPILINRIV